MSSLNNARQTHTVTHDPSNTLLEDGLVRIINLMQQARNPVPEFVLNILISVVQQLHAPRVCPSVAAVTTLIVSHQCQIPPADVTIN